jgi:hypothetical protein
MMREHGFTVLGKQSERNTTNGKSPCCGAPYDKGRKFGGFFSTNRCGACYMPHNTDKAAPYLILESFMYEVLHGEPRPKDLYSNNEQ